MYYKPCNNNNNNNKNSKINKYIKVARYHVDYILAQYQVD